MTNTSSRRLATPEAAEYLGVSAASLERWRCVGGGPQFLKLGGRVVYDTRDLITWLESQRRRSTSDPGPAAAADARDSGGQR